MLPENVVDRRNYPRVHSFIKRQLSMQYGDIRSMIRLPLKDQGITHGCNFAATSCLCSLVSGISVSLYKPVSMVGIRQDRSKKRVDPGILFKMLIEGITRGNQAKTRRSKRRRFTTWLETR